MARLSGLKNFFTYKDMLDAYLDCRRYKRNKASACEFETCLEVNLRRLQKELNEETYEIGPTQVFSLTKPRPREIWAASFRDRVVHHLVYRQIGSWFERRFIEDTFSCIPGRGTLRAAERLEKFCRSITEHWSKPAYVLQVDIANYFCSINRNILCRLFSSAMEDSLTTRIFLQIIRHDPTTKAIVRSNYDRTVIPPHKSLWNAKPMIGLPIGNLTSQFASNVYLDAFDKFVKHTLRAQYYVRYVDDMVLLSHSVETLRDWLTSISFWLLFERGLRLHPDKIKIYPITSGIDFVGHIIKPYRVYSRRRLIHAVLDVARRLRNGENLSASLRSYIGFLKHTNSYNFRKLLARLVPEERAYVL